MLKIKQSIHYILLLTFLTIFFVSCDESEEATPNVGALEVNLDKTQILQLVNSHRSNGTDCSEGAKDAVGGLTWNDELAKAALDHSNDMATNNYFSHEGLNGSSFSQRARDAGYAGGLGGENIAQGYSDEASVIQGWMDSNGHCNNIMNGSFTEIGVARSATGNYWTMVLGRGN